MAHGTFNVPYPINEPVLSYAPGTPEREALQAAYQTMYNQPPIEVPMYLGAARVTTDDKRTMTPPHEHGKVLGHFSYGTEAHVTQAIDAALEARKSWANLGWEHRAAVFLKAADLIAGPSAPKSMQPRCCRKARTASSGNRRRLRVCRFLRFNAYYAQEIHAQQPESADGIWNRLEYRPLEGFVFAITPFNFTAIVRKPPAVAALMGNVVVWKPSDTQVYSAQVIMEIFQEAGLPDGVINMVTCDGPVAGNVVFKHRDFAGLHFTGSTGVFRHLWKTIGENLEMYRSYPRIVGETGGKDFVVAHPSANVSAVVTGLIRGAFEFQGQKCSAASRAYMPASLWPAIKSEMQAELATLRMGSPEDFGNFINAVIDRRAFDKIKGYIDFAKAASKMPKSLPVAAATTAWILRGAHRHRNVESALQKHGGRNLWPCAHRACLRRQHRKRVLRRAGLGGFHLGIRTHRRGVLSRPLRVGPRLQKIGKRGRQLLPQRQAHRCRRGAAAFWRRTRIWHE